MILLGILLLVLGLVLTMPILFWIGVVLVIVGICVNVGNVGDRRWW